MWWLIIFERFTDIKIIISLISKRNEQLRNKLYKTWQGPNKKELTLACFEKIVVVHASNLRTWEAEAGGSLYAWSRNEVPEQPWLLHGNPVSKDKMGKHLTLILQAYTV